MLMLMLLLILMLLLRYRKRATARTVDFNLIECRVEVDKGRCDGMNELIIPDLYLLVASYSTCIHSML